MGSGSPIFEGYKVITSTALLSKLNDYVLGWFRLTLSCVMSLGNDSTLIVTVVLSYGAGMGVLSKKFLNTRTS